MLWTVRFGLESGMRWGEMCRAQVSDIDFKTGEITIHQTKSGRMRRVRLPDHLLIELRGRIGRIIPYSERSGSSINRDVRRKTGIKGFCLKQLRTTYACRFLDFGGSLLALQRNLGHASITTTEQNYGRLSDGVVRVETERVQSQMVAKVVALDHPTAVSPYALVAQVDRATVS